MHSVKSEHLLRPQAPGIYPDKLDLQDQDSHLYGPLGQLSHPSSHLGKLQSRSEGECLIFSLFRFLSSGGPQCCTAGCAGQHQEVPHRLHQGADRQAGEGVRQGELHQQTKEMRARKRTESAGEHD